MSKQTWLVTERIQGCRRVFARHKCDSLESAMRIATDGANKELWATVRGPGLRCPVVVRPASGYGMRRGCKLPARGQRGRFVAVSNEESAA